MTSFHIQFFWVVYSCPSQRSLTCILNAPWDDGEVLDNDGPASCEIRFHRCGLRFDSFHKITPDERNPLRETTNLFLVLRSSRFFLIFVTPLGLYRHQGLTKCFLLLCCYTYVKYLEITFKQLNPLKFSICHWFLPVCNCSSALLKLVLTVRRVEMVLAKAFYLFTWMPFFFNNRLFSSYSARTINHRPLFDQRVSSMD